MFVVLIGITGGGAVKSPKLTTGMVSVFNFASSESRTFSSRSKASFSFSWSTFKSFLTFEISDEL